VGRQSLHAWIVTGVAGHAGMPHRAVDPSSPTRGPSVEEDRYFCVVDDLGELVGAPGPVAGHAVGTELP
jgi:hypothetical protein